jgi:L-serine dehydratase
MPLINSVQQLVEMAESSGKKISEIMLEIQESEMGKSKSEIFGEMKYRLKIMEDAMIEGLSTNAKSLSGLSGGDAMKMKLASESAAALLGGKFAMVMARALAVSEVNACMGRVVAAPTAGSCGILPAALLSIKEDKNLSDETVTMGLFTASAIGLVIAERASLSGAEGGCQAECGSATAMAAAAIVEMVGGTPSMAANACAIALKSVLGLVCDPVAGLVEVPCIKRNAMGAVSAIAAADMALAGIKSFIPADEVIDAMGEIGHSIPASLRETSKGGLAVTTTGLKIAEEIRHNKK